MTNATTLPSEAALSPAGAPIIHRAIAAVTRCWPFLSGCGAIANHPRLRRITHSRQQAWARVPGGEILAPLQDHVGRAAFYCGDLDPKVSWLCRAIVKPGDTVFDIGANIGVTTVLLSSLVGTTGRLHSFEPNPQLVHLLRQVIARNDLRNTTLHPIALGQEAGVLQLNVPADNFGMGSLVRHVGSGDSTHEVRVQRLDEVMEIEAGKPIRFIKIDVEGFEADVFNGADRLFAANPPEAILCEINDGHLPLKERPVVQILGQAGYELLGVPRCMTRMKLVKLDLDAPAPRGVNDVLAVRKGVSIPSIERITV